MGKCGPGILPRYARKHQYIQSKVLFLSLSRETLSFLPFKKGFPHKPSIILDKNPNSGMI